jgi:GDP-L-fucose synthase
MARIPFELKGKTVFVAGMAGMVGPRWCSAQPEDVELLAVGAVDLRDQATVFGWFAKRPQVVFLAAAGQRHRRQPRCAPGSSTTI